MKILTGFRPLSFQNSSLTFRMLDFKPSLQCQSNSTGSSSSFCETNRELGFNFKLSIIGILQSSSNYKGVFFGWVFLIFSGKSKDSMSPVPMPLEIAQISFFYVGLFVLSTAKMYCFSGFVSKTFLTILARSVT